MVALISVLRITEEETMKRTLEKRIILFSFIILFLTILANTGMDIIGFRKDYINALFLRSQSLGTSVKGSIEKVLGLGLEMKDLAGISERCREWSVAIRI